MIHNDAARYASRVDPSAPNNPHAFALDLIGGNKRVLELGCAVGHVTRALVEQGCSVIGCEVDPEAATEAREVAEAVHVVDLADSDAMRQVIGTERFDVVLAGDVLEHLPDPLSTLRTCRSFLAPAGYLVVSVPNIGHVDVKLALLAGRFDYTDMGLLDRTHLRFFTRSSIEKLLRASGFLATDLRRVVATEFETEVALERAEVPDAVLAHALADPEARTYQFVIKAVQDDGDAEVANLAGRVLDLQDELAVAEDRIERAGREAEPWATTVAELQGAIAHLEGWVAKVEGERDVAEAELAAVRSSRAYRLVQFVRRTER